MSSSNNDASIPLNPMESILVTCPYDPSNSIIHTRYRLTETVILMGCRSRDAPRVVSKLFEILRKKYVTPVPYECMKEAVHEALQCCEYNKPEQLLDYRIASDIKALKRSFIVLLGGTSGTGKSTLASLLAGRLGLTTVLSTDSIRHMLRSVMSKETNPCLFASTYEAGETLQPCMTSEINPKRWHKKRILKGYKLQSTPVLEKLDEILTMFEKRNESLVVEGVHLNTENICELLRRHPTCIPFVIYISNEVKHRKRFAFRARHMTLDPLQNKYIKYFNNIRVIQTHLCKYADRYLIPEIDNTSVDRSLTTIQATLIRVLSKLARGEKLLEEASGVGKVVLLSREYEYAIKRAWSSKAMTKALGPIMKQKVSKRLLLRRLLSEQQHQHQSLKTLNETSSSSSDGEVGRVGEEDNDDTVDLKGLGSDEEIDEQATVVGSLASATYDEFMERLADSDRKSDDDRGDFIVNRKVHRRASLFGICDPKSDGDIGISESKGYVKCMLSHSAAINQAARWRAGQIPGTTHSNAFRSLSAVVDMDTNKLRRAWNAMENRNEGTFPFVGGSNDMISGQSETLKRSNTTIRTLRNTFNLSKGQLLLDPHPYDADCEDISTRDLDDAYDDMELYRSVSDLECRSNYSFGVSSCQFTDDGDIGEFGSVNDGE